MPPNIVKVDRTTHWGNPFRIDEPPSQPLLKKWLWKISHWDEPSGTSEEAVRRFTACIAGDDASIFAAHRELRGKNLACWCKLDQPCHADVLLKIANYPRDEEPSP